MLQLARSTANSMLALGRPLDYDRGFEGAGAVTLSGMTTRNVKNATMAAVPAMTAIMPC